VGSVRGAGARTKIVEMGSVIGKMAAEVQPLLNTRLRATAENVSKFISAPLSSEHSKAFELVKRQESSVFSTFVSIVYAKALLVLVSSPNDGDQVVTDLKRSLSNPGSEIEEYLAAQGKLGAGFIGHLVNFSEVEAQLDPHFDKVMNRARQIFLQHKPAEARRDPFSDPKSGLDLLGAEDSSAWWRVPTSLAFVMTVTP
jgi:hypothetical protein